MKIIGQTRDGYIVEASEGELANAMGFGSRYAAEFKEQTKPFRDRDDKMRVGAELNIARTNDTMGRIVAGQDTVAKAAESMRAIAGIMEMTLAHIIPAQATEAAPAEGAQP